MYLYRHVCMNVRNFIFCRVLKLFPKGNSRAKGKYLSVFLYLADNETLKPDEKIFTQVVVRILNPLGSNHVASRCNY